MTHSLLEDSLADQLHDPTKWNQKKKLQRMLDNQLTTTRSARVLVLHSLDLILIEACVCLCARVCMNSKLELQVSHRLSSCSECSPIDLGYHSGNKVGIEGYRLHLHLPCLHACKVMGESIQFTLTRISQRISIPIFSKESRSSLPLRGKLAYYESVAS